MRDHTIAASALRHRTACEGKRDPGDGPLQHAFEQSRQALLLTARTPDRCRKAAARPRTTCIPVHGWLERILDTASRVPARRSGLYAAILQTER